VVVGVKTLRQPAIEQSRALVDQELARVQQDVLISERQRSLQELQASEQQLSERLRELTTESEQTQQQIQETLEEQELTRQRLVNDQEKSSRLQKQASDLAEDRKSLTARVAALQKAIDDKGKDALKVDVVLTSIQTTEQQLSNKLRSTLVETQKLKEVLEETQQAALPKERIQHRLSPVTKPVEKGELHFRISRGRISEIPLEDLLDRLKDQVMARRSTVMRFNQYEGTVGPVRGYTMTYTVEKEGPSTLEALQNGDGRTRVNVSRWKIDPDASLMDESFEEAVRPGSNYRQTIETAAPDTVVTMWIYPDSFKGFGTLREVAHGLQLRVAARPLPEGTPIVGSPSGSKSTAQ
jgi:hypothetical protein